MWYDDLAARFPVQCAGAAGARRRNRLGTAFLVVADVEATRRDFALFLASVFACVSPRPDGFPCGECRVCRKLRGGGYEELVELSPVGKARQIPVGDAVNPEPDTLRYFEERLYLTGAAGKKAAIIHDADRLNPQSQNALLKTLEEPPADSVIILLTAAPSALLPTTRSRCQQITLLENRCDFDFAGSADLFAVLNQLWFGPDRGLAAGAEAAAGLLALFANLQSGAQERAEDEWKPRLLQAKNLEMSSTQIKNIEKKRDSVAAGLYGKYRRTFLEAIYAFAAQAAMLADAVPLKALPAPAMLDKSMLPARLDADIMHLNLDSAAELVSNFDYQISEDLAVRSFALDVAMRR